MARIISISVRREDEWIIEELQKLAGPTSFHVSEAIKAYLQDKMDGGGKPYWYIEGRDYSHLPLEQRIALKKFGYSDPEVDSL